LISQDFLSSPITNFGLNFFFFFLVLPRTALDPLLLPLKSHPLSNWQQALLALGQLISKADVV